MKKLFQHQDGVNLFNLKCWASSKKTADTISKVFGMRQNQIQSTRFAGEALVTKKTRRKFFPASFLRPVAKESAASRKRLLDAKS